MKLPMHPYQHGTEMVTVTVGMGDNARSFSVHKALLCKVSEHFRGARQNHFKESVENIITLEKECPMAFAVFYDYIYSGQVQAVDFYTQGQTPEDVHWLRTLKLADFTIVHPLLLIAYNRIRDLFTKKVRRIPSTAFINELYDDAPQEKIQRYVVAHTRYWITEDAGDWREWKEPLEAKHEFGVAVAAHFAKANSETYQAYKGHASADQALYADNLFPDPKTEA